MSGWVSIGVSWWAPTSTAPYQPSFRAQAPDAAAAAARATPAMSFIFIFKSLFCHMAVARPAVLLTSRDHGSQPYITPVRSNGAVSRPNVQILITPFGSGRVNGG